LPEPVTVGEASTIVIVVVVVVILSLIFGVATLVSVMHDLLVHFGVVNYVYSIIFLKCETGGPSTVTVMISSLC
jgi:hypothetical protein